MKNLAKFYSILLITWIRVYKTFFMLNSTKHEIFKGLKYKNIKKCRFFFRLRYAANATFPAHKCKNANNCWHFNIYEQEKFHVHLS